MAITIGVNGKLYINTGTAISPTYVFIGGQKSAKVGLVTQSADITNKGDAGWERELSSTRGISIEIEGLVDESDEGFLALADLFWSNLGASTSTQKLFRFQTPGGRTYTGQFNLSKVDENYEMKEGVGYSASLKSCGAITKA